MADDKPPTLSSFLGRAYAASHGLGKSQETVADVQQEFILAARQYPELLNELRARMEELTDDICCRCYISRSDKTFLMQVSVAL